MLSRLKISSYAKVIFSLIFILILLSIINIVMSIKNTFDILKTSDSNNLETIKNNIEISLLNKVNEMSVLSSFYSENPNSEYFKTYLENIFNSNFGFYSISFIRSDGYQELTYPSGHPFDHQNVPRKLQANQSEFDYFLQTLNSKSPVVSHLKTLNDGKYGLNISVPVFEKGTGARLGILVGRINYNYIKDNYILSTLKKSQTSAFVMSKSGELLFSPDLNFTGINYKNLNNPKIPINFNANTFANMEKGLEGFGIFKSGMQDTSKYKDLNRMIYKTVSYTPVSLNNKFLFSIAVSTPLDEIGYFLFNVIVEGILIILFGLVTLRFVNRIHHKSLNQEVERARVMAELMVANEIIKKDRTIVKQTQKITMQNKKIVQQKSLVDQLYKEALEHNKNKTEFFSNIAHELKTPLSVILSTVQLLEHNKKASNDTDSKFARYMNIIKQNSYRTVRLINSLLQISKIEAGYMELHLQNVDVIKLIREICLSISEYLGQKNITFEFKCNVDKFVSAVDPEKMERILLNLLSNAFKFTEPGGKIIVEFFAESSTFTLSVRDTGAGIPNEKLDIIFERFGQARTPHTKHHEGVGIGLSLVRKLIELHNGKIEVHSEIGKGTEFKVIIPIFKVCENQMSEAAAAAAVSRASDTIRAEFSDCFPIN